MKNVFKSVFVIIGTIIGAGFASGKELYIFFFQYGFNGMVGIIITTILFTVVIYKTLSISNKKQIYNYNELKINSQIKHTMSTFLLISFYIMIAGFAAFVNQELNIPSIIGSILITSICYITFIKGVNGIIKANAILIPVLILVLIHTCYKNVDIVMQKINFFNINMQNANSIFESSKWILRALEYVGYNSIILIPILINIEKTNKKNGWIAIISGIIFFIMAIGIIILLYQANNSQILLEIPTINIVSQYGKIYKYIFQFIIAVSIYTSAISAGYGFLQNEENNKAKYIKKTILILISAIFISVIGFTYLVEILYPLFGLLGIIQIIMILKIK